MIYSQQETQKYTVKQVEQYLQKIKEKYVYTNYNLPFPVRQILKDCFIVSTISYSIIDENEKYDSKSLLHEAKKMLERSYKFMRYVKNNEDSSVVGDYICHAAVTLDNAEIVAKQRKEQHLQ